MFLRICGFIGWLFIVLTPALPYFWLAGLESPSLTQTAQAFFTAVFLFHVVVIASVSHFRERRAALTEATEAAGAGQ